MIARCRRLGERLDGIYERDLPHGLHAYRLRGILDEKGVNGALLLWAAYPMRTARQL
jgi:hypothetical protein